MTSYSFVPVVLVAQSGGASKTSGLTLSMMKIINLNLIYVKIVQKNLTIPFKEQELAAKARTCCDVIDNLENRVAFIDRRNTICKIIQ